MPEPVHEAGHGEAADVQQADAVDAALEVETVRAEPAQQEGEGGGEGLVLVLRHEAIVERVIVKRKANSIVQNGRCRTRFRRRAGPYSGGVQQNRR